MKLLTTILTLVFSASASFAATYNLFDHDSAANQATYDYGLRMEGAPDSGAADYWSFETLGGASLATMVVDFGGGTASITGSMRHNLDNSLWTLNVAMTRAEAIAGTSDGSFGATSYTATLTDGNILYDIVGKSKDVNGTSYEWTLFLSDPGGNTDWRAPNITAGWLSSLDGGKTMFSGGTNDFIAQVEAVPLPAGVVLILTGFGALGVGGLRKRKAKS